MQTVKMPVGLSELTPCAPSKLKQEELALPRGSSWISVPPGKDMSLTEIPKAQRGMDERANHGERVTHDLCVSHAAARI